MILVIDRVHPGIGGGIITESIAGFGHDATAFEFAFGAVGNQDLTIDDIGCFTLLYG